MRKKLFANRDRKKGLLCEVPTCSGLKTCYWFVILFIRHLFPLSRDRYLLVICRRYFPSIHWIGECAKNHLLTPCYVILFTFNNIASRQLAESGAHVVMAVRNPKGAHDLIQKWQADWAGKGLPLNIEVLKTCQIYLRDAVCRELSCFCFPTYYFQCRWSLLLL